MSRTKHVTIGNTARRNGETRTHGPLAPNQVRYLLRYIPLEGVLLTDETKTITQKLSVLGCYPARDPRHGNRHVRLIRAAGGYGLIIQHRPVLGGPLGENRTHTPFGTRF